MRNPTSNLPPAKYVTGHLHRFVDLNSLQLHPHSLIDEQNVQRDESVEAKWEQIQQYESRENPSLSSLASSTASNSTSSTTSGSNDKLRSKLKKLKQQSLKKLSGFKLWSKSQHSKENTQPPSAPATSEVSTVPNGLTITKLRASKSMQNLEQITRDSLYNLKDISQNLRQKYNSKMELRHQSQMYNELWDDEDEDVEANEELSYRRYDY